MTFKCDRNNETLDWFLVREKFYGDREEVLEAAKNGTIIINNKTIKDINYKPKKGDKFFIKGHTTFTVEN